MSHSIDFKSHGLTKSWHGHWTVSDFAWKLAKGSRPYLINRFPHSAHLAMMKDNGFQVVTDLRINASPLSRESLATRFAQVTDEDMRTASAFIQAVKPDLPDRSGTDGTSL